MINIFQTKEVKLLILVLLIAVFIAIKVIRIPISGEINLEILQQKGAILNLDSAKNISNTKRLSVPTINFVESRKLEHKNFGELGFSTNFFMNLRTKSEVLAEGNYTFYIASDDGFRFKIDDKIVCEHPENRGYKTNICHYYLKKKSYDFHVAYYQGGGPMGLTAKYKLGAKIFFIGHDSKYMKFKAGK